MPPILLLKVVLPAFLFSWASGFAVYRLLLRWNIIDKPNQRSSHLRPTARGGGIAIVATVLLGSLYLFVFQSSRVAGMVGLFTLLLASVSFVDDMKAVDRKIRFGCHALVALGTLWILHWPAPRLVLGPSLSFSLPAALGLPFLFFWIAGYTNAFNFMDGINGLAAGQAAVTGFGMALLAGLATGQWASPPVLFSLLVSAAALGFLPHNFPRARMFMGDVSSASLGYLLASLVLWLASDLGWELAIPLLLLHANFVLDTGLTLLRRALRGEQWYESHREHFYQLLVRSGKSHAFVTSLQMGLQLLTLALMLFWLSGGVPVRIITLTGVIMINLGFFWYSQAAFNRAGRLSASPLSPPASQLSP